MVERHTIETRVGPLAVRVVGDGPTAVLWPSLFMDERSWERLVPTLSGDRRLVVVNGPGHGASGDPGRRYSLRDCAAAAGQVLDRLEVGGAVDWVGNAWGGHVGLRFAADQPQEVSEPRDARVAGGGAVPARAPPHVPAAGGARRVRFHRAGALQG